MSKVTVYFKNGLSLEIWCEHWEFQKSSITGGFTGYKFKGLKNPVGFDLNEMIAYEVKELEE